MHLGKPSAHNYWTYVELEGEELKLIRTMQNTCIFWSNFLQSPKQTEVFINHASDRPRMLTSMPKSFVG